MFIKVGVSELHPLYVTLLRAAFGTATLLVILLITRTRLPRGLRVWGHLALVGAINIAVPFTLFGYGEQHISSVLAGLWNATTPLLALPMAVYIFHTERLTVRRTTGVVLGFCGVLVILGVWQGSVGGAELAGQLMCFGAAACYGFAVPYARRFLAGRPESGPSLATGQLIMATVQLAIVSPLVAGPPPTSASWTVLGAVFMLGAFGTGIAFAINYRVIRVAGATTAATITYLIPVVSTTLGIVVLGESLTWHQPLGAAMVLLGAAVSQGVPIRWRGQTRRARRQWEPVHDSSRSVDQVLTTRSEETPQSAARSQP